MKQSNFNFFYKLDNGKYLAFNALKNGLAEVDEKIVKKISSLEAGSIPDINKDLLVELKKGGFVCDDDYDEYGLLTIRRHKQQYSSFSLGLTISPTTACNLACTYCFENHDAAVMDETVVEGLLKYIDDQIKSGIKALNVGWYGGEPLLCMDLIERLSKKFTAACKKNKIGYSAFTITNGTLYTKEIAEKLKELKVKGVQITIDGDRDTHDRRRPYHNGQGSFDRIFENVKETVGVLPIHLRTNVDTSNVEKVLDFYKGLRNEEWFGKNLGKLITVHYGHVRKFTSSCRCSIEETLKPGDFFKKEFQLHKYLYDNGCGFNYYPKVTSGCCATAINSYVVGPKGELYKCWNQIGIPGETVGTVFEPFELNPVYISYLTESFENDEECRNCKFLPACMGGCVDIRVKTKRGDIDSKNCAGWKYCLEKTLRQYYLSRLNNIQDSNAV